MNWNKIRRKLIILKFSLSRAYVWVQTPGMILIMAGILAPYIQQYWEVPMWQIATIAFIGLIIIGIADNKMGLLKTEISYNTEHNSLLLQRLKDIENKIDNLDNKEEEEGVTYLKDFNHKCTCGWSKNDEFGMVPSTECPVHGEETKKTLAKTVAWDQVKDVKKE